MSILTTAVLSHGLFVGNGSGFPIPYDVRDGVDNGNGEIGTLTSPAEINVRSGVMYGGDGTQYTGTLNFTSSSGDSWTDDAEELFEDMRAVGEYRAALVYNGQTVYGVKMALSLGFQMRVSGYQRKADTSFDLLRTECVTIGLYALMSQPDVEKKRVAVTVNREQYIVLDLKDDNATDPTVKLILSALQ